MNDATYFSANAGSGVLQEIQDNSMLSLPAHEADLSPRGDEMPAKPRRRSLVRDLLDWWPVLLGVVLAYYGAELRTILSSMGDWALRFFMPMVVMAYQANASGFAIASLSLPQVALILQFPLEGMMVRRNLRRGVPLSTTVLLMFMLHVVSTLLIWMLLLHRYQAGVGLS
jgi:hypothetical protein